MTHKEVLEALKEREPIFHRDAWGKTRADFERQMDEDFWEVVASGTAHNREEILDFLEERYAGPYEEDWKAQEFKLQKLAEGLYLLTYVLIQNKTRVTRRSTLWRLDGECHWRIVYHQGTVVQNP
ncbi:MAG: DUF4440 domain-containing protein [Alphaproteobacteria bacterium]|nr:DUF4440 domain-containing protein [Alphaproteobacteria bacterium]